MYGAQKEYARSGDTDVGKLLVQLLADRAEENQRNLKQIVLNESLEVASKLTPDQLDALSLIFNVAYCKHVNVRDLQELQKSLRADIWPFLSDASRKTSAYQHLEYAGCGSIGIGQRNIGKLYRELYPGLFSKGFTAEEVEKLGLTKEERSKYITACLHDNDLLQVAALDEETIDKWETTNQLESTKREELKSLNRRFTMSEEEAREYLSSTQPFMIDFIKLWEETNLTNLNLTSVGIAIAHANVKRKTGMSTDLQIWL